MRVLLIIFMLLISNLTYADFIVTRGVNIREQPSTKSPVVDRATVGDILLDLNKTIYSGDRNWFKIISANGVQGYVASENVDVYKFRDNNLPVQQSTGKSTNKRSNTTIVSGSELHRVNISLKDLNRITCSTKISDPIFSKDKEIEIVRGGDRDLFVKISPIQIVDGGEVEIKFNEFEREVFVECNGVIYSLTLIPRDNLPTQTIIIKSAIEEANTTRTIERSSNYEKLISELVKSAYNEQTPNGYNMKKGNIAYKFEELDMRLRYQYVGFDYVVEDWELTSKLDNQIELEENTFVPVLKSARAISFVTPKLAKDESTRMIVVRLNNGGI